MMAEHRRRCRVQGEIVGRRPHEETKCREKRGEDDPEVEPSSSFRTGRGNVASSSRCGLNRRNGTFWACCSRAVLTFDQSSADCLQLGSPFAAPLIALNVRASEAPVLVSWQDSLPSAAQLRPPKEASEMLRLEDGQGPALPISGLTPSSRILDSVREGVVTACSVVCVQRPWSEAFEVFFLSWDVSCGYALVGSGASWQVSIITGKLEMVGPQEVRLRLLSCRELADLEARELGAQWVASFEVAPAPPSARQGCDSASAWEEEALQSWLSA